MKKFALISLALPPSQSGQSIVLYHLLKGLKPSDYCLITQKNFHLYHNQGNCSTTLTAPYHFLYPDYQVIRLMTAIASMVNSQALLNLILKIRVGQIKRILRKEEVKVVISCTGDLFDPAAAFLASRDLGIPFILYAFDYYSHQWIHPVTRSFAEKHEEKILSGAAKVVVPNECMEKEYARSYNIKPVVIHNPFDLAEYEHNELHEGDETGRETHNNSKMRIVYTGAVYDAHYSAFRNLIAAIPKTGIAGLTLHIYTPQLLSRLLANGISGPVTIHKSLPNSEMPPIQRSSDILFLPLAFNSAYPGIINTSAPGKIGEYLASKRPVLVHAPKDSFIARYFRKYSCGYVVDQDDPDTLAQAITLILKDKKLQRELSDNAYQRAKIDFDITGALEKFQDLLNV